MTMLPPTEVRHPVATKILVFMASAVPLVCLAAGEGLAQSPVKPAAISASSTAGTPAARGVIRPWHEVKIAVDLVAKVKSLPLRVGDRFNEGNVLLEFDCARFQADLRAAKATESEQAAVHRSNVTLQRHKAVGSNDVDISRARLAKATADAESLSLRISQCKIVAPFSGRVAERMVDAHELPQANQPLLRIVNDGALEIALIVPANWLKWLKQDQAFAFTLDDTGASAQAVVTRIGAAIDPVSQTVEVFGKLQGASDNILPGMGGSATFTQPQS
ncbi:MAG: efflux RND transporter periplasmic adaptor subunit [Beijerinckiaceae bacterium]